MERGLLPEKSYEIADVDTVNIFNGVLNVRIPIGQSYHVNADLSYQFGLSYATNSWEHGEHHFIEYSDGPPFSEERVTSYSFPERNMNAGFGWILTLGQMIRRDGDLTSRTYLSPDGAQHLFYDKLHENNPDEHAYTGTSPQWVGYTRDGTYLREKQFSDGYEIEFPNGDTHSFDRVTGMLKKIEDLHGNTVTVQYGTRGSGQFSSSSKWTVSDSTGRVHYVYFRPAPSYEEAAFDQSVTHEMVDYVDVAAFDGARAEYHFDYDSDGLPTATAPPSVLLSRRCPVSETTIAETVRVSMLKKIRMPENLQYQMTYDLAGQQVCSSMTIWGGTASGNLLSLVLPNGTNIAYRYEVYTYPSPADDWRRRAFAEVPGIVERTVTDGTTKLAKTSYGQDREYNDGWQDGRDQRRLVVRRNGGGEVMSLERHYFSTCVLMGCPNMGEYGLPLTRSATSNGAYLSTETMSPDGETVKRSSYVLYEADANLSPTILPIGYDLNRRLKYTRTVFEDAKYRDATYSDFDGLGHYRQVVTKSDIGDGSERTDYTGFNPGRGTFNVAANGTVSGTFIMPPVSADWQWDVYDVQRATENGLTFVRRSCFDAAGFLTARRVYDSIGSTPALHTSDLVVILGNDTHGNVSSEQYLGGDLDAPPLGGNSVAAPLLSDCVASSASQTYRVNHTYAAGSRQSSYAVGSNGLPMSHFLMDNVIDVNTGLVKSSRSASTPNTNGSSAGDGLQVVFQYDLLSRLTQTAPQGSNRGASRRRVFSADTKQVDIFEESAPNGTLLRKQTMILDGLGRVVEEKRSLPSSLTASRIWQYDELGRITAASAWGAAATPVLTRFEYDEFGRVTRQIAADGAAVTHAYTGFSSLTTTSKVRTGGTAENLVESNAATTTEFDSNGRAHRVTDPSGVVTRYTYDVGGRLTNVCADEANACVQNRVFTYDNRGFLTSEQSPELGAAGNGSATYRYDPRGNVIRRTIGAANGDFDVWMDYDPAGRHVKTYEAKTTGGVHRTLKLFEYGTTNTATDFRNGRRKRAVRFNWVAGFNIQIVEDYVYAARDGRVSEVETYDYECDGTTAVCNVFGAGIAKKRDFKQTYVFDALGAVTTLTYPQCLHTPCAGATTTRTLTNVYDQGWLTSVTWTGAVSPSTITYYTNGMVDTVTHGNLVEDKIELDGLGMSRPYRMSTTNVVDPAACVAPSFDVQPRSQTVTSQSPAATLTAHATGEAGLPITYQWYIGTAPQGTETGGNSSQLSVSPGATTRYWVKATNACASGSTASDTATVTVCVPPTIGTPHGGGSITRGQSLTLTVVPSGSGPFSYQWYTVSGSTLIPINGEISQSITVEPTATTTYRVRITNACGNVTSTAGVVTVAEPPTVPQNVSATSNGSQNTVTWGASTSTVGIARYEVSRRNGPTSSVVMPAGLTVVDGPGGLATGAAYLYRVRAVDQNGIASAWSGYDLTVRMSFTDDPIITGVTEVRGIHIGQLRQAIDAVRLVAQLPPAWSSYAAATGLIDSAAITGMRTKMNEARIALGLSPVSFASPTLIQTIVRVSPLQELRNGVK